MKISRKGDGLQRQSLKIRKDENGLDSKKILNRYIYIPGSSDGTTLLSPKPFRTENDPGPEHANATNHLNSK